MREEPKNRNGAERFRRILQLREDRGIMIDTEILTDIAKIFENLVSLDPSFVTEEMIFKVLEELEKTDNFGINIIRDILINFHRNNVIFTSNIKSKINELNNVGRPELKNVIEDVMAVINGISA